MPDQFSKIVRAHIRKDHLIPHATPQIVRVHKNLLPTPIIALLPSALMLAGIDATVHFRRP
jgi:hypothetical protein